MQAPSLELNLARRLRPKAFDDVFGQDFSVRVLKNGLYSNSFFPLYIFAGLRGCGKTSTARIFGASINCRQLEHFQKDPSVKIPCLACESCVFYLQGNHPDFIEIDAASHTGVDNVRTILESAQYLPVLGIKKVYLIDEAHMLSKAAFNAFLKILEEPPKSVIFMLATTELSKVPDTVRSRAFQLFFDSVDHAILLNFLEKLAQAEGVDIEKEALDIIVEEGEGSIRDTINIFERVRLLGEHVSKEIVLKGLGKISPRAMCRLIGFIVEKNVRDLLLFLESISYEALAPQALWNMFVVSLRALLWAKHGVKKVAGPLSSLENEIAALASQVSATRLLCLMNRVWEQEDIFLKTPYKHAFFEKVLVELCMFESVLEPSNALKPSGLRAHGSVELAVYNQNAVQKQSAVKQEASLDQALVSGNSDSNWGILLSRIEQLKDPLLFSIFNQASFHSLDEYKKSVNIAVSRLNAFFIQKVQDEESRLLPHVQAAYPGYLKVVLVQRNGEVVASGPSSFTSKVPVRDVEVPKQAAVSPIIARNFVIDDENNWPKATLLKEFFSGRIESLDAAKK